MANLPSYNPKAVESGQRASHRNRAVTDLIEPGSTLKPLTVAAALEAGVVTPDTLIDTNPGWSSEERRVGRECVSTCRVRWPPYHQKQQTRQRQSESEDV